MRILRTRYICLYSLSICLFLVGIIMFVINSSNVNYYENHIALAVTAFVFIGLGILVVIISDFILIAMSIRTQSEVVKNFIKIFTILFILGVFFNPFGIVGAVMVKQCTLIDDSKFIRNEEKFTKNEYENTSDKSNDTDTKEVLISKNW